MACQLYRHFDGNGQLLYVGISLSTVSRLSQHRHGSDWFAEIRNVTIEDFPTREAAVAAEQAAIAAEKPRYNLLLCKPPKTKARPPAAPTPDQIRAARKLLGMTLNDLGQRAGL